MFLLAGKMIEELRCPLTPPLVTSMYGALCLLGEVSRFQRKVNREIENVAFLFLIFVIFTFLSQNYDRFKNSAHVICRLMRKTKTRRGKQVMFKVLHDSKYNPVRTQRLYHVVPTLWTRCIEIKTTLCSYNDIQMTMTKAC